MAVNIWLTSSLDSDSLDEATVSSVSAAGRATAQLAYIHLKLQTEQAQEVLKMRVSDLESQMCRLHRSQTLLAFHQSYATFRFYALRYADCVSARLELSALEVDQSPGPCKFQIKHTFAPVSL